MLERLEPPCEIDLPCPELLKIGLLLGCELLRVERDSFAADLGGLFRQGPLLALQRTNILRDLKGDAADGRCYVPATWLAAAGCERDWLAGLGPDAAYAPDGAVARIRAQLAAAAAACFARAHAALRQLPRAERRALVPARIMGAIYGELLRVLRSPGVDGRGPRVRIGKGRKAWLALQVFAGVRP